jgi:AbrB family looped-hinge helix DNA binding protein
VLDECWESDGTVLPVEAVVDSVGRLVVPKALRDALGLTTGTKVDISLYGSGLQVVPVGRTARLVKEDGRLVADSDTVVTDEDVFGLLESIRR